MKQKTAKKKSPAKQTEDSPSVIISPLEKSGAISESAKAHLGGVDRIVQQVDRIIEWLNQEKAKLDQKADYKAFLSLDFNYLDRTKRTAVDTILRLLGTRILTSQERLDPNRSPSIGIQATNRPNVYIYYEHKRPEPAAPLEEKYILFVANEMKLPRVISPQKLEEVTLEKVDSPQEIVPKSEEPQAKTPGIFETINKALLGE